VVAGKVGERGIVVTSGIVVDGREDVAGRVVIDPGTGARLIVVTEPGALVVVERADVAFELPGVVTMTAIRRTTTAAMPPRIKGRRYRGWTDPAPWCPGGQSLGWSIASPFAAYRKLARS
jgi:hypothetical protein